MGNPIGVEEMLTGESLPTYSTLAAYLLYTASGISTGTSDLMPQNEDGLFYENDKTAYYLLYEPSVEWLRGEDSMLNETRAKRISAGSEHAIVFAPGKYIGQRDLTAMGITFCQLPYEMYTTGR